MSVHRDEYCIGISFKYANEFNYFPVSIIVITLKSQRIGNDLLSYPISHGYNKDDKV